jgi:MFS family permease
MDADLVNSDRSESERIFFGWWVVGAAFLITAVTIGVFYSYGVFFLPVMAEFGWSRTVLSGVALAGGLTYAATVPLVGWLADRYGFRPVMAVAAATLGLGFFLCSLVQSVWQLYLFAGVICGLGSPIGTVLPLSMVARWFVKRQGLALGIASAGIGAGAATVPLLATGLISALGWRVSYALLGLLIWVTCIPVALMTMRDPAPGEVRAREGHPAALKDPFGSHLAETSFSLSQAVQTSSFWYLFSIFGLSVFCLGLAMTHLVPHARDSGLSAVTAAGLLSAMGTFSIVGRLVSGMISDRIGARLVLAAGVLIQGVMMLWLVKVDSTWAFYLFAAIFGLSYGGNIVLIPKLTSHFFGLGSMGAIFGALSVADGLGFGTGPLMAGYIFDTTGSYQMSFFIVAGAMAVALAATLALREKSASDRTKG